MKILMASHFWRCHNFIKNSIDKKPV